MARKVRNMTSPKKNVENNVEPSKEFLHIDFTKYQNWCNSCSHKGFTNFYENDKHIGVVLSSLIKQTFPYLQANLNEVLSQRVDHCHLIKEDKDSLTREILNKIHGLPIGEDAELWQFGTAGGARLIGVISADGDVYTLYPMMIDCNHLLYPSIKHNGKSFKNFKRVLK